MTQITEFSWQEDGVWQHGPLSNGFIEPDGSHVEGEYQAYAKTTDKVLRSAILWMPGSKATSAAEALVRRPPFGPVGSKQAGRKVTLRPDHEEIKVPVMAFFVARKFREHEVLRHALIDTGDAELIEANSWHDNFWGDCRCGRPACNGPGRNTLGTILMTVRATL